jgi:PAS domain S-box-containing protein
MLTLYALLSLFSSFIALGLGIFVHNFNSKKTINRIFGLLCISISYCAFTDFMLLQSESIEMASVWYKLGFLWPFTIALLFHFVLIFTGKTRSSNKRLTIFSLYGPALVFSIVEASTGLIGGELIKVNWGYAYIIPETSLVFWLATTWLFSLGFLALILCVRYQMNEKGIRKNQAKFVTIAFSIPIFFSLILQIFPIYSGITIPDLSVLSTTVLCVFVAYAIWKYDLFVLNPIAVAENIINLMPDSLILIDTKGNILAVNKSLGTLLGYTDDELIDRKIDLAFPEEHLAKETLHRLFKIGELRNYETKFRTKSNQDLDITISASSVKDNEGQNTGAILICRNITESIKIKEQLFRSEKLAAIGQAATMVGHDLRNPLQAIENGVYLLTKELSRNQMSDIAKTTIDAITQSIEYADNIVNNLRSFTKEEKPIFLENDINSIVKSSLALVNKPDNVELVIETDELPNVKVDKEMLKRVFVNLTTNGMQAMKENGGTLTVKTRRNCDSLEVSFKDTGEGISKESMTKLFTPFFTTKAQGMGVGLALCKKFVELNEGTIEVESEETKGSKFTVKLNINKIQ